MNRSFLLLGSVITAVVSITALAHDPNHGHKESTEGKPVTIQGELIDAACFVTSNGDAKGKDHAQCAQECMSSGIPAGILPEGSKDSDSVMYLLTNPRVLAPYAAQTIKVEGIAFEDKHAIDVKKLFVKQGNDWKEVQLEDEHHKPENANEKSSNHGK